MLRTPVAAEERSFRTAIAEALPGLETDPASADHDDWSLYETRRPWNHFPGGSLPSQEPPRLSAASLQTRDGLCRALSLLVDPGFILVDGVEPSEAATGALGRLLFGRAQQTLYGQDTWRTEVRVAGGNDTAYTAKALPLHMDGCYMADQPGFQMFHCLQASRDGGGLSTLADGLAVLAAVAQDHPDTLAYFCRPDMRLPYHHTDGAERQLERLPVLTPQHGCDSAQILAAAAQSPSALARTVRRVHYNDVDRAPLSAANAPEAVCADMPAFYLHWKRLMLATRETQPQFQTLLQPGTVMVFDNQRLLHGRTAFAGDSGRVLAGCYGRRADFESRLRLAHGYPSWCLREADARI